jgi:hypothetical protein
MSARNGDKSGFNRERKQKIARRKRTHEPLERTKAPKSLGMNTPLLALPLFAPIPDATKKKRVLLIDTAHTKRDLRAEVLRKLGMDVPTLWKPVYGGGTLCTT